MKKTLEQCCVMKIDNDGTLLTEEDLYMFVRKGTPVLELPYGSLIYTGEVVKGPGGFPHAVFGVWKRENTIKEKKLIFLKKKEKENG